MRFLKVTKIAVARSENLGRHAVLGGNNVPTLVEVGLADLQKKTEGGGLALPLATALLRHRSFQKRRLTPQWNCISLLKEQFMFQLVHGK